MVKKIILIILTTLLLCGCEAKYTLYINSNEIKDELSLKGNGKIQSYEDIPTESELQNVEVRAKPLDVIYIDNKRMVLASRQKENPIAEEGDYSLKLIFTLNSSSAIKRVINVDSYVEKLYEDEGDESKGKCWSCCFKSLKEEDNRFLYEKIYGRLT